MAILLDELDDVEGGISEPKTASFIDAELGELPDDEEDLDPFRRLWRQRGDE